MANKNDLFDFDETTAVNNDNVQGANIAENCAPSGINNAIRGLASIVKRAIGAQGSPISSAATTPIGAAGTALYATITGTTTITGFGSVAAGTLRILEFAGALTLTHNATSLKLPGSANILTAAGDVGLFMSLGSGNWKCLHYSKANGSPVAGGFSGTLTSTDPGAGPGPTFDAYRNSASAAASDALGRYAMSGNSSTGVKREYGAVDTLIVDPTNGSEDSNIRLLSFVAGTQTAPLTAGQGIQIGAPATGDKGVGTLNAAAGLYIAGHGTVAQTVIASTNAYVTCGTILPNDDTIPQNTEGNEVLTASITPTNPSSILLITFTGFVGGGANQTIAAALFVDSTANALNATVGAIAGAGSINTNLTLQHQVSAGSTAARTYKIRIGSATAADAFLNGDSGGRQFGGVATSVLKVEEILPQ